MTRMNQTTRRNRFASGIIAGAMAVTMILPVSSMDTYAASKGKTPKAPTKVSMSVSEQNMTLKWNKGKNAKSYQVAVRTSGKGWKYWKKVKKSKANKKKFTKKLQYKVAKSGKKYKVYRYQTIYRYKTVKKNTKAKSYTYKAPKAGSYYTLAVRSLNGKKKSGWKAKTGKSLVGTVKNLQGSFEPKTMKLTLTWSKASGATKYEVYRLTDDGKQYELIGSTAKTNYTTTRYNPTQDVKIKILPLAGSSKGSYSSVLTLKPQDVKAPHEVTKMVDEVKCKVCGEDMTELTDAEKKEKHGTSYYCSVCGEKVISHNKADIEKHIKEQHSSGVSSQALAEEEITEPSAKTIQKDGIEEEKTGNEKPVKFSETKAHSYSVDPSQTKDVPMGYEDMTIYATYCGAYEKKNGKVVYECNKDLTEWGEKDEIIQATWWKENVDSSVEIHIKNGYITDLSSLNNSYDKWQEAHPGMAIGEIIPENILYNEYKKKVLAHFEEDKAKGLEGWGCTWDQYETRRFPKTKQVPKKVYTCDDCGMVIENY